MDQLDCLNTPNTVKVQSSLPADAAHHPTRDLVMAEDLQELLDPIGGRAPKTQLDATNSQVDSFASSRSGVRISIPVVPYQSDVLHRAEILRKQWQPVVRRHTRCQPILNYALHRVRPHTGFASARLC